MHAWKRMSGRSVSPVAVEAVLRHGRVTYVRGAVIYALGRKEVRVQRLRGRDLTAFEGLHVVCSPDGAMLTTYRNHDFRSLRPRGRCQWKAA